MADKTGTELASTSPTRWVWVVLVAAGALGALEAQQLVTLIGWERTLPFAREFLPSAITTAAMTLGAYLGIIALILPRRPRKWGLALGIGWGAIVTGMSLWLLFGHYVKNVWQELLLRLHMTNTLIRYEAGASPQRRIAVWIAGLAALLALSSAKGFADTPRDRRDPGIIAFSIFYAALYYLAMGVAGRLVTPH